MDLCSCWWIHEKEQLLGQQSCGWVLCHICCAKTTGVMELCLTSLSARSPGACTAFFLLGKGSWGSGQGWGHLGAAGARCPQLCSCRIQGESSSSKLSTCSPTSVCVLVWCWALSVPNEHWKTAHLHCWVFQQTKENLIISSWLASTKFCWAAKKDSEGQSNLNKPILYLQESTLQWHHCNLGYLSRGWRQISGVAGS